MAAGRRFLGQSALNFLPLAERGCPGWPLIFINSRFSVEPYNEEKEKLYWRHWTFFVLTLTPNLNLLNG